MTRYRPLRQGHNQLLIRQALQGRDRHGVVLSVTFGALPAPDNTFVGIDGRPAAVQNFLASTPQRLGTDHVDIYRLGRVDPAVPIEDTVGAIAEISTATTNARWPCWTASTDPLDLGQDCGGTIVGMERPSFDVLGFLHEPGRPASVATVSGRGRPALATMWFLVEDDRLWFHTAQSPGLPAPFLRAARERSEIAVMVATFNPPADDRQVRMTGPARLEEQDHERVRRLYRRYVDMWTPKWERQATSGSYRLWSMSPDHGMAVTYPGLNDGPTFRWSQPTALFRPGT